MASGATPHVIVVGAGPAGAIAALVLARAGVKVRLVERTAFPRDKLCGDTLNPGALAILDGHGLGDGVRARSLRVRGMTVTGPHGARVAADYPVGVRGAALMRRDLDVFLLDAAMAAGAEFGCGVAVRRPVFGPAKAGHYVRKGIDEALIGVRVATAGGEEDWRAGVVIAADGRHSTLAFALGLARYAAAPRRWAFGAYFTDVEDLGEHGEMHIRPDGYIGVAPLPSGVTNLCVVRERIAGRAGPRRDREMSDHLNAEQTMATALATDPMLRERFANARRVSPISTLGPLAVEALDAGRPGLLLAGDAAGFIDPMTGDGLRFALRGGELAAAAALRELSTGKPAFAHLRRARAREFSGKWRINRALRSLVASPRGVSLAASITAHWDAPVRALVAIAGDVHLAADRSR
jgi:menaquinone-9 beta-reductase